MMRAFQNNEREVHRCQRWFVPHPRLHLSGDHNLCPETLRLIINNVAKAGGDQGPRGRFSSKKKLQAVLRLLQGKNSDTLSRELKANVGTLSASWDSALNASFVALSSKPSFVGAPEGNGVAEWFIRTLKKQLL